MKKIKTVFKINRETSMATSEMTPGADWVLAGEGEATLKVDGSACMVKDGNLYKRWDRKLQSQFMKKLRAVGASFEVTEDMFNVLPGNAIPCQESPDPVTYHHPHWVEIDKNKPEDAFHIKALESVKGTLEDGTYELLGPKVNNNPHQLTEYKLVKHGSEKINVPDRSFEGIKAFLEQLNGEGIVFHHESGEMFKIRRKDMCNGNSKVIVPEGQTAYIMPIDTRNMRDKPKMKM